jgi:hypothetical protein
MKSAASPNISPGNAMIVPGSSFSCGFVIESIPPLDGEGRSAWSGDTLYFTHIPGMSFINYWFVIFSSDRVKYSG